MNVSSASHKLYSFTLKILVWSGVCACVREREREKQRARERERETESEREREDERKREGETCSFTIKISDREYECVSVSYLHVCESVEKCVCQKLMHLLLKHLCVCVCGGGGVRHAHLALVAAEWGIPIIIIKPTLFSLFEVRRLPLPLATTFQTAQPINPYTHTHACTQTLLCAVPGRSSELLHGVFSALLHFHFMSWEPSTVPQYLA